MIEEAKAPVSSLADATPPPSSASARALVLLLTLYQRLLSPVLHLLGGGCRFTPTCSAYAIGAVKKDGALRGSLRAAKRLSCCHPFHPGGFDPP